MSHTVSPAVIRAVLDGVQAQGADADRLVRDAGLAPWAIGDDGARIPFAQLTRLWQVAAAGAGHPHVGLRAAMTRWRPGVLGTWDYLFLTANTLADACSVGYQYLPILNSARGSDGFRDHGAYASIRFPAAVADPVVTRVSSEFGLMALVRRARVATGKPVVPVHVRFAHAAPAASGELASAFGTRSIDFGADCAEIAFSRAALDLPLLRADPALARILRDRADIEIASPGTVPRWIDRFRQVLAGCLDDQSLALGTAARRLTVSARTLQRLLEQEGTSWRAEVDAARRARAGLLIAGGISKTQAASRLGYSDARALRRAVRRWDELTLK